ncbi:hypothetical protein AJ80_01704 [Polytolypa hystricis UAMH7299]|uniref:SprT-like domain-containing protein n=1 Tax=Polytolypa hystricis (strain UAMH7299) TaxID=1447883 RepID=A0A2B7YZ19_POLH7|nr:hypothetical protein AJ80_01704 [Polytolypa hystricis UAMH7299]
MARLNRAGGRANNGRDANEGTNKHGLREQPRSAKSTGNNAGGTGLRNGNGTKGDEQLGHDSARAFEKGTRTAEGIYIDASSSDGERTDDDGNDSDGGRQGQGMGVLGDSSLGRIGSGNSSRIGSPGKRRTLRPLRAAQINSLLLPLEKAVRNMSITDGLDRENRDPVAPESEEDGRPRIMPAVVETNIPRQGRETPKRAAKETQRRAVRPETAIEEELGDSDKEGFNSLDDFIIGDDESVSYFENTESESGEEEEWEGSFTQQSPGRKLFRGVRPKATATRTTITTHKGNANKASCNVNSGDSSDLPRLGPLSPSKIYSAPIPKLDLKPTSSLLSQTHTSPTKQLIEDMDNLKIYESDRESSQHDTDSPPKTSRKASFSTPPSTPSKPRLNSPSKPKSRIPPSPHRANIDAFWNPEIINEWNDEYSPKKSTIPRRRVLQDFSIYPDDEDTESGSSNASSPVKDLTSGTKNPAKKGVSPTKTKLSEAAARKALVAKKREFDARKISLAENFLKELDDTVTGGEVQKLSAATGGIKIIWSKKLNTTAGRANWKRVAAKQKPSPSQEATASFESDQPHPNTHIPTGSKSSTSLSSMATPSSRPPPVLHHASIELAEKIIDNEDRLINTLAHEYCHLANFMISEVRNNPHGASFKAWAAKCTAALERNETYAGRVEITTKHSYDIHYKYLWCCEVCGYEYGRHSKSIDTKKSRCGKCKGVLVQVRPKPRQTKKKKKDGDEKESAGTRKAIESVAESMGSVRLSGNRE